MNMPWYKTGTVKTTINSNAIIGTGTAFISNSRVGDAFRGPDGAWYEVTNIASDTAMSISPNYQGPTVAAGTYSIAPMQGYVKESADALRGITNTYGTKLLALGTTGNYDVLPVVKGGTGGTTPAAARTGLGLGTSATLSVTTREERALPGNMGGKVADAGFRGISGFLDLRGSIFETGTPTDLIYTGFITGFAGTRELGIPSSALSGSAYVHLTVVTPLNGVVGAVGATTIRTARVYDREVVSYATSATTWSDWSEPNVRGGANSTITSLSGLTTALSISQGGTGATTAANARTALGLGTASTYSVDGVGGIIESGSTANGEYTKMIDGTLICRLPIKQTTYMTVNVLRYPWSFPSPFLAGTVPNISITVHGIIGINRQISGAVPIGPSNTGITLDIYSKAQFVAGDEVNAQVSAVAIGRWKA